MNLFLKIVASLPILIYFIIIRPTLQQESWDQTEESTDLSRFLNTMMMGMGDKIKDSLTPPSFNFSKPDFGGSNGDKPDVGSTAYTFLTSFVNQTRSTIPLLVRHSNFTLIQAALLFTIGCMAAGAATIVLEGLAFRQRETEIELYKNLHSPGHHEHPDVHGGAYGLPPQQHYGVPSHDSYSSAHSEPIPSFVSAPDFYSPPASASSSNSDPFAAYYESNRGGRKISDSSSQRRKRDTGGGGGVVEDANFLQLSKPYRRNSHYNSNMRPGYGFHSRFQQISPVGGDGSGSLTGERRKSSSILPFGGAGGLIGSSSQQIGSYGAGYPDPNNYLMLNRLGMKRKHYGSQKRRVQNFGNDDGPSDDDEMEYARGILSLNDDEMEQFPRIHRQRKYKKSRLDREQEAEL